MSDNENSCNDQNCSSPKAQIKALEGDVVHRICTGQVILSLSAACKELIENSLDAGATFIEIRVKEFGLAGLEVLDNGSGIRDEHFEFIAKPHCTSKIDNFAQLSDLETFGFRGEALSALAALSDLTITTKTQNSNVGFKLRFDHAGNLAQKSPCARPVGTSASVENFFAPLIVRRKEFEKNCKKEYTKLVALVQAYCIINFNIRFELSHFANNRKQTVLRTTQATKNSSLADSIISVFGSKQMGNLIPLVKRDAPTEEDCAIYNITEEQLARTNLHFDGFVSAPKKDQGRYCTDRQFVFVNGRPCDYPKICKIVNEIYHEFNRSQFPVLILSIVSCRQKIDVNVTPDKRTVYLSEEKILFALLRSTLKGLFSESCSHLSLSSPSPLLTNEILARSQKSSRKMESSAKQANEVTTLENPDCLIDIGKEEGTVRSGNEQSTIFDYCEKNDRSIILSGPHQTSPIRNEAFKLTFHEQKTNQTKVHHTDQDITIDRFLSRGDSVALSLYNGQRSKMNDSQASQSRTGFRFDDQLTSSIDSSSYNNLMRLEESKNADNILPVENSGDNVDEREIAREIEEPALGWIRKVRELDVDLDQLGESIQKVRSYTDSSNAPGRTRNFRANIVPEDNDLAVSELSKRVDKSAFKSMRIIGQFNRGFIIVVDQGGDLFIVDQHASDEKFNFEAQLKSEMISGQDLFYPLPLDDFSPSDLNVIRENLTIFRKNGFNFEFSTTDNGKRCKAKLNEAQCEPGDDGNDDVHDTCKVLSMPFSDHVTGSLKEDLNYLIKVLTDFPQTMCRPPSVRRLFASRACRKSVMVGSALNQEQMRRIVSNLADLDQPWNCPHGRPTMRHLYSLRGFN